MKSPTKGPFGRAPFVDTRGERQIRDAESLCHVELQLKAPGPLPAIPRSTWKIPELEAAQSLC